MCYPMGFGPFSSKRNLCFLWKTLFQSNSIFQLLQCLWPMNYGTQNKSTSSTCIYKKINVAITEKLKLSSRNQFPVFKSVLVLLIPNAIWVVDKLSINFVAQTFININSFNHLITLPRPVSISSMITFLIREEDAWI